MGLSKAVTPRTQGKKISSRKDLGEEEYQAEKNVKVEGSGAGPAKKRWSQM